jgi:hypothetical protein
MEIFFSFKKAAELLLREAKKSPIFPKTPCKPREVAERAELSIDKSVRGQPKIKVSWGEPSSSDGHRSSRSP